MTSRPTKTNRATVVLDFAGRDGLHLVGERSGDLRDPPVIFLHGGGQTRHSWGATARRVAERGWQTLLLDARGHGDSGWSDVGDYRLESFAHDLQLVIGQLDRQPFLVGASLGGLTSILVAGELAPGAARGVVLVDIVPDMEETGARRIGAFMVEHAETGFSSIDEAAEAVAAYNPHRAKPTDAGGLRKNLRERDGRFYWHWDPRFMIGNAGSGPSEILDVDRLHTATERMVADVPVMLVRGRVSDLVTAEKAAEFCARFPAVEYVDVSDAGHMVAGDRNDAFTASVIQFLDRHASQVA
jgi:pimeloyl-ACP methyl ester carboxylesterase